MLKRLIAFIGILAMAGTVAGSAWIVWSFNHFTEVTSEFNGKCNAVAGIAGPADLQIDFATGMAFVSSFDRRKRLPGEIDRAARGAIHLFNIDNPLDDRSWNDRTGGIPEEFEPQGIHFYVDDRYRRLFVVNGANKSVELFDVLANGDLEHLESFNERRLTSPNDVVATGPRSFYVSSDRYSGRSSFRGQLSFLFRRRTGKIFYFNGTSWHLAVDGIQYANGVAVNADGSKLFVSETSGGNLLEYTRDRESGYLTLNKTIKTGAAVDNINIDSDGILWIGAHPRPLSLVRHQRDRTSKAPSTVFSFDEKTGELTTILSDDGSLLSGSSSAARNKNKLVIGALYEEKFLICDMAEG